MSIPAAARRSLAALELLATVEGGTDLSPEQHSTLAGFTGWGPLAPALGAQVDGDWVPVADRLDEVLDAEALQVAGEMCDTSFYTPEVVSEAIFALLERTGFTGGRILEPGCGSGSIMAAAPAHLPIDWTGIDADPTAAKIAQLRNPEATIIAGRLEKKHFPAGSFDAVVGNVPFSQTGVYDPNYPGHSSLHGYFTARALDAVKPGGYLVLVTSRYTLDSVDEIAGSPFDGDAELVSAVRLPAGTFDGTGVVADILVLRKSSTGDIPRGLGGIPVQRVERKKAGYRSWMVEISEVTVQRRAQVAHDTDSHTVWVSGIWEDHPELVAGTMQATGFSQAPLTVKAADRPQAIADATAHACALYSPEALPLAGSLPTLEEMPLADAEGRKEGSFHVIDGKMAQVQGGALTPVARASKELFALVELRDAVKYLLELESNLDLADADITSARERALNLYLAYAGKFGPIGRGTLTEGKPDPETGMPSFSWRRPPLGGFRKDPDYLTVLAAEQFDQETGEASPAPILERRVNRAAERIDSTDNPAEAARLAAAPGGIVNVARAAELLSMGEAEAARALEEHTFVDPAGRTVLAADYLSGNIREKIEAAERAGLTENVAALTEVLPEQVGPMEIIPQLGATWIGTAHVEAFAKSELKTSATITRIPALGVWEVDSAGYSNDVTAQTTYGTPDILPVRLLELALNGAAPVIYDEVWEDGRTRKVKNAGKTVAAEEKQNAIRDRFETWLWEDKDRADEVCAEFNRRFRSHRPRSGDGSHLTFPGLSDGITLWDHQKDAVDRIISDRRTILHHTVGAGKTLEILVGAMKLKQLGLAQKPLIAVPNHLLEQIAREARTAYPTGRFLIAGREEMAKDQKRLFAARCATGDWDAVIMTHTAFTSIPVAVELEQRWVAEQKAALADALSSLDQYGSRRTQKRIAAALRRLEAQLDKIRDDARRDPDTITFEQLGVDHISIDELHYFRRLMVTATSQSGFSLGHSKRATDLHLKLRSLSGRHPNKPIFAGFTGTLISNTLAEIFVWQTLTQPERLAEAGVETFDAWAATFVKLETAVEVKPTGQGFHMRRRPRAIRNAPELAAMLSETCDTVTVEQIGLERPDFTIHNVVSEPTDEQMEAVALLAKRADDIYAGLVRQDEDNMLAICGEGRALALDPALVSVGGGSPTVADAADRIALLHHENADRLFPGSAIPGMLQLVLCDLGTPKPGNPATYGRLRQELAARGVPAERIRFIHEATTDKARTALFSQCRAGEVSVLIGSTSKVGVGTNIQTRLGAIHHLDAPWTPADVEQREGRAIRPKNLCEHVDIFRYVTEGTFDALNWETLERKEKSTSGFITASSGDREVADVTETALSYGQVKALATGQPELLRLAELDSEIRKLSILRSVWAQQVNWATDRREKLQKALSTQERRTINLEKATLREDAEDPRSVESLAVACTELRARSLDHWNRKTNTYTCLGFGVEVERGPLGALTMKVMLNYAELATMPLDRKIARRGHQKLTAEITRMLTEFSATLPETIEETRERAGELSREIADLTQFLDTAVFDRELDLQRSTNERALILARLSEAATPLREEQAA